MALPQFRLLATTILQKPELADDVRFLTNTARVANREALVDIITEALRQHNRNHWIERLSGVGSVSFRLRAHENGFNPC